MSLPTRLPGPLAFSFFEDNLILVPWARPKKIATVNTKNIFRRHFPLIRENDSTYWNYTNQKNEGNETDFLKKS